MRSRIAAPQRIRRALWRFLPRLALLITVSANAQVTVPNDLTNPCNPLEGNCDASNPNHPLFYVNQLADAVTAMQEDLLANWAQPRQCGTVEHFEPQVVDNENFLSASNGFNVYSPIDATPLRSGTMETGTDLTSGSFEVVIDVTNTDPFPPAGASRQWTLTQTVSMADGSIYIFGTLDVLESYFPF